MFHPHLSTPLTTYDPDYKDCSPPPPTHTHAHLVPQNRICPRLQILYLQVTLRVRAYACQRGCFSRERSTASRRFGPARSLHSPLLHQNNLISKIENLKVSTFSLVAPLRAHRTRHWAHGRVDPGRQRMKDLKYINLALNNITRIDGLGSCEKLVAFTPRAATTIIAMPWVFMC